MGAAVLIPSPFLIPGGKMEIKETKELLVGVNEIALLVVKRLKDGVQLEDFVAFWNAFTQDAEFKAKVQAAYEKANEVPAELGDLQVGEIVELVGVQVGYVPKFVEVFKS
jgi:hypothetical protein